MNFLLGSSSNNNYPLYSRNLTQHNLQFTGKSLQCKMHSEQSEQIKRHTVNFTLCTVYKFYSTLEQLGIKGPDKERYTGHNFGWVIVFNLKLV